MIGIPLCLDDRERWREGRRYHYIDGAYARAIERAGGVPMYLPMQEQADRVVSTVDGVLIPGGDDFPPPTAYPESVQFAAVPEAQLTFDRAVLAAARASELPVLGICYGMQLLALEAGGRLHYDIGTDLPAASEHQLPKEDDTHVIEVEPGSRLARLLGRDPEPVNSRHHQAVAKPGGNLVACARAADGVIEAIEAGDGAFCIGVQWHPEQLQGAGSDALFRAFVRACAERLRG